MVNFPPDNSIHNPYDYGFPDHPKKQTDFDRFKGDAISDEDFERCYLYDSPLMKKIEVDDIENITLQIFTRLHSLADRNKRSEIQAALAPTDEGPEIEDDPFLEKTDDFHHNFRPFRRETNFYAQEERERAVDTKNVARNIFSVMAKIFLGYEFLTPEQDLRTPDEMKADLNADLRTWYGGLKKHYYEYFNSKMTYAFRQADELLTHRQAYAREAYYHRLTFYATLIISAVGKLTNHRAVAIVGLAASVITLIYMLVHYGKNSYELDKKALQLKLLVELAEKEASANRDPNTTPLNRNGMRA